MSVDQHRLKELIREGIYVVDERRVAEAIVARIGARAGVVRATSRRERGAAKLRRPLFRRHPRASSFRLSRTDTPGPDQPEPTDPAQ